MTDQEIDWSETGIVHVDLRRGDRYDPDPYTVTLEGESWLSPWGRRRLLSGEKGWPGTVYKCAWVAESAQGEKFGNDWTPVLVQIDGEIVWRKPLGLDIDADYERALQDAGLTLPEDVRRYDDLTDVDGIGKVGAGEIRKALEASE